MRHDIDAGDGVGALQPANGFSAPQTAQTSALVAREVQSIQGAIISAKNFPRDQGLALKRIEGACARVKLAEQAMYSYARGGQEITGPSIRMAEVLAQNWGNIDFGFKEVERHNGESVVVAYCIDYETNVRRALEFRVPHVRETKKGSYTITSERDIYELVANMSQRRVRSCILALIPGDVVEAAIEACERTLNSVEDLASRRQALVKSFAELEISVDQIERRIGKKIASISSPDFVQLRKIYQSLKDGMSKSDDWFEQIHEPEKIKKAQADSGTAMQTPADKSSADADRRVAVADFQKALKLAADKGGNPDELLGVPQEQAMLSWPADRLFAAADRLTSWASKK